jgi:hypothetical protein
LSDTVPLHPYTRLLHPPPLSTIPGIPVHPLYTSLTSTLIKQNNLPSSNHLHQHPTSHSKPHINHNGRHSTKASRQPLLRLLLQSRRIREPRLLRLVRSNGLLMSLQITTTSFLSKRYPPASMRASRAGLPIGLLHGFLGSLGTAWVKRIGILGWDFGVWARKEWLGMHMHHCTDLCYHV